LINFFLLVTCCVSIKGRSHSPQARDHGHQSRDHARRETEVVTPVGKAPRKGIVITIDGYDSRIVYRVMNDLEDKVKKSVSSLLVPFLCELTPEVKKNIVELRSKNVWIKIGNEELPSWWLLDSLHS